jgi:hypothetical protein
MAGLVKLRCGICDSHEGLLRAVLTGANSSMARFGPLPAACSI